MASERVKRKGGAGPAPALRETACPDSPSAARASDTDRCIDCTTEPAEARQLPLQAVRRLRRLPAEACLAVARVSGVRAKAGQNRPEITTIRSHPGRRERLRPWFQAIPLQVSQRPSARYGQLVLEHLERPALTPAFAAARGTHRSNRAWRPGPAARHIAGSRARRQNGISGSQSHRSSASSSTSTIVRILGDRSAREG